MSAARANGVPAWSTSVLRFSRVNTTPAALPQLGHLGQGLDGRHPHRAGDHLDRPHRQPVAVEAGAVQVQVRRAEPARGLDRERGRGEQRLGAVGIDELAVDVPGHRREPDARLGQPGQLVEVLGGPVPDLRGEAEVVDVADPVGQGQVPQDHLDADREGEGAAGHGDRMTYWRLRHTLLVARSPRRPRVVDIATQSGLSRATVDRVLHGREGVRPETVAQVERAVAELERQRTQASALRTDAAGRPRDAGSGAVLDRLTPGAGGRARLATARGAAQPGPAERAERPGGRGGGCSTRSPPAAPTGSSSRRPTTPWSRPPSRGSPSAVSR